MDIALLSLGNQKSIFLPKLRSENDAGLRVTTEMSTSVTDEQINAIVDSDDLLRRVFEAEVENSVKNSREGLSKVLLTLFGMVKSRQEFDIDFSYFLDDLLEDAQGAGDVYELGLVYRSQILYPVPEAILPVSKAQLINPANTVQATLTSIYNPV